MSQSMYPFYVEFQNHTQTSGRLLWAVDAWDALRIAQDVPQPGYPLRATLLVPDRIFEFSLQERKS